jgi:hypothetical protein
VVDAALAMKEEIQKELLYNIRGKLCQRLAKLNVRILFDSRFGPGCQLF